MGVRIFLYMFYFCGTFCELTKFYSVYNMYLQVKVIFYIKLTFRNLREVSAGNVFNENAPFLFF